MCGSPSRPYLPLTPCPRMRLYLACSLLALVSGDSYHLERAPGNRPARAFRAPATSQREPTRAFHQATNSQPENVRNLRQPAGSGQPAGPGQPPAERRTFVTGLLFAEVSLS